MENSKTPKCYPHDDWRYRKYSDFPRNFIITPGTKSFLNPGNVESLHQKARDILPVWLEGVQLNCRKNIHSNLMMKQSWILSHNTPSGFRFGGSHYWKAVGNILVSKNFWLQCNFSHSFSFSKHH
jgi:mitochondrial import receptor subunit TOM40